jgi:hypothetical protein
MDKRQKESMQNMFKMTKLDSLNPGMLAKYNTNLANLQKQYGKTVPLINLQNEALKRTNESIKESPFQGWAMSIMFAGMAVKNFMTQIWTSSTKTFNDVKHSVEGTVTGFDMLTGSLQYLGFNVGAALEPLAIMLIPIIDYVSQLVQDHPDAFKWLFAALTVLGTAAAVGGSIILAKAGIEGLGIQLGIASKNAQGLMTYDWSKLGTTIQKSIGSVAILWSMKKAADAFSYFEDGKFVNGFLASLSSLASGTGGLLLLTKNPVSGGIMLAIATGLSWVENDTLFTNIGWLFGWIVAGMSACMLQLGWSWNQGWKQMVADAINLVTGGLGNTIAKAMGFDLGQAITGASGEFDFSGAFETGLVEIMTTMRKLDMDLSKKKDAIDRQIQDNLRPVQGKSLESAAPGVVSTVVNNIQYNFVQKAGEDNAQFVNRIMAEIRAIQAR